MGAVWGDYDNDGYEDLLVYKWGRSELFHNDDGKGFTRVTDKAGLPAWVNASSAIWLDYDRDGMLDLFLAGYWADDIDLWHLKTTKIMPESFRVRQERRPQVPAAQQGRRHVRGRDREGRHQQHALDAGRGGRRSARHRLPRPVPRQRLRRLRVLRQSGAARRSSRSATQTGVGEQPKSGMNVSFGDVFNHGRFCIYVSNISEPGVLVQGNNLWVPERARQAGDDRATPTWPPSSASSWAAGAGAPSSATSTTTARSTSS